MKIYNCIFPVTLYGCQIWSLTYKLKRTIQICQKKNTEKVLNILLRDSIPNKELHSLSSNRDVLERATKLKCKWGGHVARLHPERCAHAATMGDPYMGEERTRMTKTQMGRHAHCRGRETVVKRSKRQNEVKSTRERTT